MRTSLFFAFLLTAAAGSPGAVQSAPPADPCGDPVMVSQGYMSLQGTVLGVVDPVTLLVEVRDVLAALIPGPPANLRAVAARPLGETLEPPGMPPAPIALTGAGETDRRSRPRAGGRGVWRNS
jgi:hypothetical protein